ncbi:transcription termination factor NusA [Bacilliculturomica massiliensis]|uniref:transcription termination factor NusA n=1 Tax=Bacilliculturomica massiliensis TaxID=1917867 RepID=UPI001030B6E1|nr:transcription termination factor NusA [Bacilliculturomica massiliensis]
MNREFIKAVEDLEKEKSISKDLLIDAIESALVSAYKKNYGTSQNVRVNIDRDTGDIDVFMRKDVVDEVYDPFVEVDIEEAKEIDPAYEVGDILEYQVTPRDFGRIAAQTAKQVVVQRIREAERGMIYDDYINRQGEIITGVISRISNDTIFINMGRAEGILAATEQVRGEVYEMNERLKVYIMDVKKTTKGPQVYLSRSHPGLVKRLFELEVPEIQEGVVEIKSISREAGSRTKMAVYTADENVDPVGACVGNRGSRVQAVVDELFGEKIDIINWSEDPAKLINSALSPAKVEQVIIGGEEKSATVVVPDYQLSLAIGKEGQNVRLAAKLCGWKIDIKSHTQYVPTAEDDAGLTGDVFEEEAVADHESPADTFADTETEENAFAQDGEEDLGFTVVEEEDGSGEA